LEEDALLAAALAPLGFACERVDWARADVDWRRFAAAVIRTPWDYFERFAEFSRWLTRVSEQTQLVHPAPLLRWNMDKHYLLELGGAGVAIPPTRVVERGSPLTLGEVLAQEGWGEVVVKPCVGGAARWTFRAAAPVGPDEAARFGRYVAAEAMLVQPFLPAVLDEGEVTVVVFAGEPSHAVRKRAKPGDFRVQDDHGGTVHAHRATSAELELARAALAAAPWPTTYGRVDMVRGAGGAPVLMELELVEPELWLREAPEVAPAAFARALVRALPRDAAGAG
jgi:glutathione synthase/RimK-type ligase-like ATP-grasp enzyme